MEFDVMWHGLTKTVQFQAADMSTPISITLTADLLEDGSTDTYLVPIPAGAKARHGIMRLAVKGAALNGDIETNAVLAVYGSFTVKESNWSSDAEEAQDVTPTQAEQLQSEIDVLLDEIAALTGHTEDAEAWAVGEREGAPVGPGDETYRNNAKHYAAAAAQKADAVLDMTVSAEGLPEGSTPEVEKTTSGGVFNLNFKIPHGLRGYRIGSVYRKSGTGAPGTTDVYGMKLNDPGQTEVGTFSVYNGTNGEGSGDFMADGSVPMTGSLNLNGHKVVGVSTPTANTDAANKKYVDDSLSEKYVKPSSGIPKTDLAYAVQTSLGKADSAYQKPGTGIPVTDMTADAQDKIGAVHALGNAIIRDGWNQILPGGDFATIAGWSTAGAEISVSGGVLTITPTTIGGNTLARRSVMLTEGHKYLFVADVYSSGNRTRISLGSSVVYHTGSGWERLAGTETAAATGDQYFTIRDTGAQTEFKCKNAMVFDITEIFGSGNEQTPEQFLQLFPDDYYPLAAPGFGDLLWENASMEDDFALQTIPIDLSSYAFVRVYAKVSKTAGQHVFSDAIVNEGTTFNATLFSPDGSNRMSYRSFRASSTGVRIEDAYYYPTYATNSGRTTGNATLIPYRIYGIR